MAKKNRRKKRRKKQRDMGNWWRTTSTYIQRVYNAERIRHVIDSRNNRAHLFGSWDFDGKQVRTPPPPRYTIVVCHWRRPFFARRPFRARSVYSLLCYYYYYYYHHHYRCRIRILARSECASIGEFRSDVNVLRPTYGLRVFFHRDDVCTG